MFRPGSVGKFCSPSKAKLLLMVIGGARPDVLTHLDLILLGTTDQGPGVEEDWGRALGLAPRGAQSGGSGTVASKPATAGGDADGPTITSVSDMSISRAGEAASAHKESRSNSSSLI